MCLKKSHESVVSLNTLWPFISVLCNILTEGAQTQTHTFKCMFNTIKCTSFSQGYTCETCVYFNNYPAEMAIDPKIFFFFFFFFSCTHASITQPEPLWEFMLDCCGIFNRVYEDFYTILWILNLHICLTETNCEILFQTLWRYLFIWWPHIQTQSDNDFLYSTV